LLYIDGQLQVYRWNVHLFGKTNSPCVAMMAVFTTILKNKKEYPEAFDTITVASLVDNMADSRPSAQQIKLLINQLTSFFPKHCSMHIRKYILNNLDMMLAIPPEDRIAALQDDNVLRVIFAGTQEPPSLKILGIAWNYVKDEMYFDFTTLMSPKMLLNKMELLRILHSLYDPMGVLIPFTITGKLALQMCSRQGLTWKAKPPDDKREAWDPWMAQVQELNG
jgi:hypothetical protein